MSIEDKYQEIDDFIAKHVMGFEDRGDHYWDDLSCGFAYGKKTGPQTDENGNHYLVFNPSTNTDMALMATRYLSDKYLDDGLTINLSQYQGGMYDFYIEKNNEYYGPWAPRTRGYHHSAAMAICLCIKEFLCRKGIS